MGSASIRSKAAADAPAAARTKISAAWVKALGGKADLTDGQLKAIDFSSTQVSDAQLSHLASLSALEKLDLQVTQVGDLGLTSLQKLTNLKELNLSNTSVSDAGLAKLAPLSHLRVLRLPGTLLEGRKFADIARPEGIA